MTPEPSSGALAANLAGWTLCAACVPAVLLLRSRRAPASPWLQGILRFLAVWAPVVAANWLVRTLSDLVFHAPPSTQDVLLDFANAPPVRQALIAAVAILLMPAVEEWVFRERLQTWLVRKTGLRRGIALTVLAFAAAHLTPSAFLPLAVLATGLSLARLRTGRLLPCIVMHALYNATTLTFLYLTGPSALAP